MANYTTEVIWSRGDQLFVDNKYSRKHLLRFDGGIEVQGSSSPHVVPLSYSDPAAVDPEETFVAALSSCHMLWFLSLAAQRKFIVDRYHDIAIGTLGKRVDGRWAMTKVTLRPQVSFVGERQPTRAEVEALHHGAHERCFIANSVTTEVRCEPVYGEAIGSRE